MSDTVESFLKKCSSCEQCRTVCPFLDKHGTPDQIIKHHPQLAFLCTNCTACDGRCPLDITPSNALFQTKHRLIQEGRVTGKAQSALKSARGFANRGHKAPFVHYSTTETVFWPGCSLAGTSPETVRKMTALLSKVLDTDVGLVLDCCFDPLYQMGDTESAKEACERIRNRFESAGNRRVIVGCLNCRKVFRDYLPDLDIKYVLEVLPENIEMEVPDGYPYMHYPCPFYRFDGISETAKAIVERVSAEEVDEQTKPACCGLGGGIHEQDPSLAAEFTQKVTMDAYGSFIVTACMGCKNTFLKKGRETYHILELISGAKPRKRSVPSAIKWANRLKLAQSFLSPSSKKPVR